MSMLKTKRIVNTNYLVCVDVSKECNKETSLFQHIFGEFPIKYNFYTVK